MDICSFCGEATEECTCEGITYSIHAAPAVHRSWQQDAEDERSRREQAEKIQRIHYGQVDYEHKHS